MTEKKKKRILTIPEWHQLAMEGNTIPMRIPIHGNSMFPLIRMDRDYVTIMPLKDMPESGDIVLYDDPQRACYVLHRVWMIRDKNILTWGDNSYNTDGWRPLEDIWGIAVLIERGRIRIKPNPKRGLIWAKIWHRTWKVYRRCRGLAAGTYHRVKRLLKD